MKFQAIVGISVAFLFLFGNAPEVVKIRESLGNITDETLMMKEINVNFSIPEIREDGKYEKVVVKECNSTIYSAGKPLLPEYRLLLTFPAGTKIERIEGMTGNVKRMHINGEIREGKMPMLTPTGKNIDFGEKSNNIYPEKWFTYRLGCGLYDGKRAVFLPIHLYPVRYNHNELEYTDSISLKIYYSISSFPAVDAYDLLIITPKEFVEELQPLKEHKEEHNIKTKVVTLDEIYGGKYFTPQGRDEEEKIKYFLKDAIENWGIKYVLLAGDIWHVPSRIVYSLWGGNRMYSDYYYADIYDANMSFCSWDSNGNNRFGEVGNNADKVDLYADLYVGRISCNSIDEVKTVVNKIINYENNAHGTDWFNRLVLMGGDTFPKWNDIAEGEVVNDYVASVMHDFQPVKIQTSLHNFLPNKINQILSQGAGFVCYSGHGFEYGFGTYPKNRRWMIAYYTPYLLWLKNGDKLPIIFFDACLTAKLDYHMFGNPNIPCFAWCMVKKADGGAIATIGSTETATTTVDADGPKGQAGYLDLHFFMAYKPGIHVSEMLVKAKHDYLNDIASGEANDRLYEMTIEQFILLGDPSLKVGGYE